MERVRLGELLIRAKLLTQARLDDALILQRSQGRKLGQILIELGFVNETQLIEALSLQLNVPWVSLYHIDFSRQLLNLVPREVAERYGLIPIFVRRVRKQGETLYVAMDDPSHEAALDVVRASAAMPVKPMIAAPSDIKSAIRVYYETGDFPGSSSETPPLSASATPPSPTKLPGTASNGPPLRPGAKPAAIVITSATDAAEPDKRAESEREVSPKVVTAASPEPGSRGGDSPEAWPEVEARTLEIVPRKGTARMVAVTLLDGTTIRLPAKPRRRKEDRAAAADPRPALLPNMTARDLVKALGAVAEGGDARAVFGDKAPLEAICAALLSLLLDKGLVADWEFVEQLRKKT